MADDKTKQAANESTEAKAAAEAREAKAAEKAANDRIKELEAKLAEAEKGKATEAKAAEKTAAALAKVKELEASLAETQKAKTDAENAQLEAEERAAQAEAQLLAEFNATQTTEPTKEELAKAKAAVRAQEHGEDAKLVRVVVVDGRIQGPDEDEPEDENGRAKHRLYDEGETLSMPLKQAKELKALGYVGILR